MPSDLTENRKEPRLKSSIKVSVHVEKSSDVTLVGRSIECETVDVSVSGIGILLDRFVPTDSILKVMISTLDFPLVRAFNLIGEIRWATELDKGCHAGIRFQQTGEFDSWNDRFQKHMGRER